MHVQTIRSMTVRIYCCVVGYINNSILSTLNAIFVCRMMIINKIEKDCAIIL